ncbi:FtsX-like permease family protein [Micromonospora chokoriensis]|uniref:Putative ABC transport system permease protein n=1 Tax=Micromonospora chokoriensis TaxID=356851 RepID=A0A1C4ZAE8_9ACTN|nr:FtsX-like permease family protein [Micromonospora chokoriensis]SCF29864.1 putative ABC transport system permease protein [Micromonospora chokoriensis]
MTIRRPRQPSGAADPVPASPVRPPVLVGRRRIAELTGSWRTALRIARRESRRARGRTALVLAMIALPVAALAFLAANYDMAELTPQERVDRRLGVADAELQWVANGPIEQDEWGEGWSTTNGTAPGRATAAQMTALLGPGSRVTEVRPHAPLTLRGPNRDEDVAGRVLDLGDPLARGLVRFVAGRAPQQPGEVAVSQAALRRLDLRLGDAVTVADESRAYTVVGLVEFPDDLGPVVALHPGAVPRTGPEPDSVWLADVPGTVDAALVSRLNERGVVVTARHSTGAGGGTNRTWFGLTGATDANDLSTGVLIAGLGLLEVVLLVGPAFAVGVRRRRRDLALVAVAGGDAAQLRRVVLADGVVLGVLGAAAGLVVGVGAAFAGRPLMEEYVFGVRFGGYRCWPAALVLLGAVAVLAGVLAASAPAWAAARQDVSAGLAGRRTPPVSPARWLVVGLALVVGGAGLAAYGSSRTSPAVILTGLILGELGLVACTPTLIGALARLGRLLPLAPRIAVRDASRNRASAVPAICAVMAAVASSVALGGYLTSDGVRDARAYQPMLPTGHMLVYQNGSGQQPTLAQVADAARAQLGVGAVATVHAPDCDAAGTGYCDIAPVLPASRACPWQIGDDLPASHRQQARSDPRCAADPSEGYLQPEVDDGSALPLLTGADATTTAAASAVLRAGGVVVTDPRYLHDGLVTVRVSRMDTGPDPLNQVRDLPGYALPRAVGYPRLLLSTGAARHLGLSWSSSGWVVGTTTPPDEEQQARFSAALRSFGTFSLNVEQGSAPRDVSPLLLLIAAAAGLITVGAAGIATALAAAEGRAELTTLAAVGAAPALRRLLAICQAGVIAGLGSVLGIVAGLGTAAIVLFSVNRQYANAWPVPDPYPILVPWPTLGVLVLVPVVAMLGAGLFTRARLPIERRLD